MPTRKRRLAGHQKKRIDELFSNPPSWVVKDTQSPALLGGPTPEEFRLRGGLAVATDDGNVAMNTPAMRDKRRLVAKTLEKARQVLRQHADIWDDRFKTHAIAKASGLDVRTIQRYKRLLKRADEN